MRFSLKRSLRAIASKPVTLPCLDSDVFVIGSAPNVILPDQLLRSCIIVTANASQFALTAHGIDKPDLTFMRCSMGQKKPEDIEALRVLKGRRTNNLILIYRWSEHLVEEQKMVLNEINYNYDNLFSITQIQRDKLVKKTIGDKSLLTLPEFRTSMGLSAIASCLAMGAKKVFVSGISLRKTGHSYDLLGHPRMHINADSYILQKLAVGRHKVFAVEPELAEDTGIPIWSYGLSA